MCYNPLSPAQQKGKSFSPEAEDFTEGQSEILVGRGVDDGIKEAVGVAEPEEKRGEPPRDDQVRLAHERTGQRQNEEREPAERESAHYDAQRSRRLQMINK